MKEHDKQAKAINSFDYDEHSFSDDDRMALAVALAEDGESTSENSNPGNSIPKRDDGKYEGFIGTPDSNSFDPDI